MVTFDGGGGGSGSSPAKMMNEWGIPTVYMESLLYDMLKKMYERNYSLPQVVIAGGFALEDQIYKGLPLGGPISGSWESAGCHGCPMTGSQTAKIGRRERPKKLRIRPPDEIRGERERKSLRTM